MRHLLIENLPGKLIGLLKNHPPILGIGIVSEIRAFVDKTLTRRIHHDSPGVRMFLKTVPNLMITELGGIVVPANRMTARPVTIG